MLLLFLLLKQKHVSHVLDAHVHVWLAAGI